MSKKITSIISLIIAVAMVICAVPISGIAASAEDYTVTYDYGDSETVGDGGTLEIVDGTVTLPKNDKILNLWWENGVRRYRPGETVEVSELLAEEDGTIEFAAYYGAYTVDFENELFTDGMVIANDEGYDAGTNSTVAKDADGHKYVDTCKSNSDGNAVVLFDYNENGERAYVNFSLDTQYKITVKYKNIVDVPEDAWNSLGVGFGLPAAELSDSASANKAGAILGKSNISPASDWAEWSATVTAPDTYAWNTAGNTGKKDAEPEYADDNFSRRMEITYSGFAESSDTERLYIDEIRLEPVLTAVFDYDDSENLNDSVSVSFTDSLTLPKNDTIANLKWECDGNLYEPGAEVDAKELIADTAGVVEFAAYYDDYTVDYQNEGFTDGVKLADGSLGLDGNTESAIGTDEDGNKYVIARKSNADGNAAVLFDYNNAGKRAYVYFNRNTKYVVTVKYKNFVDVPEDVWNSLSVGFGIPTQKTWWSVFGTSNGVIAGKSNIVPADEWTVWSAEVTSPDTYAWNSANNTGKKNQVQSLTLENASRRMAVCYAGFDEKSDTEMLYIDEISVCRAKTAVFDYGDSANAAFDDSKTVGFGSVITMPTDSSILNLTWENGGNVYQPGQAVDISELEQSSDGIYRFNALYGAFTVDYENEGFVNDTPFAVSGVMDGCTEAKITTEDDGNKCIVVNNRASDGNVVLFDYNSDGSKAYAGFNLNTKYKVTVKYKNICTPEDMWNSINVGFGIPTAKKWETTMGSANGAITGKSNIVPTDEWLVWTATVTSPDTYAWNTAKNTGKNGAVPTYSETDLTRHVALGFAGITDTEYLYIDNITFEPCSDRSTYTVDYGSSTETFEFDEGDVLSLADYDVPEKDGYIFAGWRVPGEASPRKTGEWTPSDNDVLSAVFVENAVTGDVDNNGVVNIIDLIRAKKVIAGVNTAFEEAVRADVDRNDTVDAYDLIAIRHILLGV